MRAPAGAPGEAGRFLRKRRGRVRPALRAGPTGGAPGEVGMAGSEPYLGDAGSGDTADWVTAQVGAALRGRLGIRPDWV